ncbi:hypothetical protein DITRI_Ditri02bG0170100 [Diplodiscus trichospermus]
MNLHPLKINLIYAHGATLAAGELTFALHQFDYGLPSGVRQEGEDAKADAMSQSLLMLLDGRATPSRLRYDGEITRAAVFRCIECISFSQLPLPKKIKQSLIDTQGEFETS